MDTFLHRLRPFSTHTHNGHHTSMHVSASVQRKQCSHVWMCHQCVCVRPFLYPCMLLACKWTHERRRCACHKLCLRVYRLQNGCWYTWIASINPSCPLLAAILVAQKLLLFFLFLFLFLCLPNHAIYVYVQLRARRASPARWPRFVPLRAFTRRTTVTTTQAWTVGGREMSSKRRSNRAYSARHLLAIRRSCTR